MPNAFAYLVLLSYPLFVVFLFRRFSLHVALIWAVLLGYLFLPQGTEFDLPLLPAVDKSFVPIVAAAIMCFAMERQAQRPARAPRGIPGAQRPVAAVSRPVSQSKLANLLIVVFLAVPLAVVITNADVLSIGPVILPGMRLYDSLSMILAAVVMLLPFFIGRRFLGTEEAHHEILRALVITGLIYSFIVIFESRMSPQLHTWIYGFFQHDFVQHIRRGGFRPVGFLPHGLSLGLYILLSTLAAFALFRLGRSATKQSQQLRAPKDVPEQTADNKLKGTSIFLGVYLLAILWLAKSLGAFLVALVFVPVVLLTNPQQWRYVSAAVAALVLIYPMARSAGVVPVDQILDWANSISTERAASLEFRLRNEDLLLARAAERPVFGWGGYGRSEVFDAFTGRSLTIIDGAWVGVFGATGWVGYIGKFGLLTLPIFLFFFARQDLRQSLVSQALCLILAANLIDLLPNAGLTPLTWLLAGALLGRFERQGAPQPRPHTRFQGARSAPRQTQATALSPRESRSVR